MKTVLRFWCTLTSWPQLLPICRLHVHNVNLPHPKALLHWDVAAEGHYSELIAMLKKQY